ncbi:MAG: YadA-like family protein, partial [Opitutaceae bacterium]|nr:YadA-like family protein [Opitutaceae bacterium]
VTAGDSDQTKAVNIASAKTIATDIAATISGSLINEANKSIAFSAGNTGAAIGLGATDAMALGSAAVANASNAIALGAGARVSDQAPGSIALGSAATANHANSVALGANTTTGEADTIAAGSRTLSQVAAKDLTAANAGYAATTGQLYNTGSTLAATLGGGATLAADGAISGWNVTLASGAAGPANYTNVADALTGLDQNLNDRIDGVISNHNADLAALDQKLDGEIATRENLITTQVRTNGIASVTDARGDDIVDIRLGNGSLVTSRHAINAPDGNGYIYEQQLFARDAGGAAININIANGSKLLVDGDEVIGKNAVQARIDAAETRVNDRIADLQTQINGLRNYDADPLMLGIRANAAAIQKLARGIAMTAALQTPQIAPGHRRAVKFGMAYYDDQTGLAGGYAERLNENVSINAEMATGYQFKEVIVRGGINYSW